MSAYDTKEAVAELVKPDQKLLAGRTAAPTPSFSARAAAFKANPPPAPPSTDMEYTRDVPMRDGRLSEMRIYQPDNSTTAVRPLFVLVHGGGFCVGNNHAPGFRSRLIAAANDMTVVNVSYRLAPEHPFPAAPNDVWDAGMPRVHLQVAGQDPVRDDGLIYEKALRAHGVETRLDVYPGLPHAFDGVFPQLKASDRAKLDMLQGIAWLMGKTVDVQRCKQLIEESRAVVPSGPPL
ncbi:1-phosphatidylinositol-4,5-bisphosphate phosphodiesterase 1 [Verticillium dahliae VDG2]|nr:1-phosphatidylinositol-4,5-bisphosphate phosphodiesterase 1 [Verticillium dahliae VDG2]